MNRNDAFDVSVEGKKAEAERESSLKRTWTRGGGEGVREERTITGNNKRTPSAVDYTYLENRVIFEASARGARGSRSGWPTDKVSSKRRVTIVTLLEVKICPRSGSRT